MGSRGLELVDNLVGRAAAGLGRRTSPATGGPRLDVWLDQPHPPAALAPALAARPPGHGSRTVRPQPVR